MALKHISCRRSLLSYAVVQRLISSIIRNKPVFFSKKARTADRLNIGCGLFPVPELANLDWHWMPGVDVCWDLRRPLPFPAGRFLGIFSEHCIDGLPRRFFKPNLAEMHRVLRPGGTLRIIFCNSEIYIDAYLAYREKGRATEEMIHWNATTGLEMLDRVFHHWTHKTLVDLDTLAKYLNEVGFREIILRGFREGRDPLLLQDQEARRVESLYVEAVK